MPRWLLVILVLIVLGLLVAPVDTTTLLHNLINSIHTLLSGSGLH